MRSYRASSSLASWLPLRVRSPRLHFFLLTVSWFSRAIHSSPPRAIAAPALLSRSSVVSESREVLTPLLVVSEHVMSARLLSECVSGCHDCFVPACADTVPSSLWHLRCFYFFWLHAGAAPPCRSYALVATPSRSRALTLRSTLSRLRWLCPFLASACARRVCFP